jgi:hypothetical protein
MIYVQFLPRLFFRLRIISQAQKMSPRLIPYQSPLSLSRANFRGEPLAFVARPTTLWNHLHNTLLFVANPSF